MKKLLLVFSLFAFSSFSHLQEKKEYLIRFNADELQIVYDALGELPAKKVEQIRGSIVRQVNEQNKQSQK